MKAQVMKMFLLENIKFMLSDELKFTSYYWNIL